MKNIRFLAGWVMVVLSVVSCSKMDDYKKYEQGKERVYPATFDSLKVYSGRNRVLIHGLLSGDPNVVRYRVYWNSRADSIEGSFKRTGGVDTLNQIIDHLPEGPVSFELKTYNGNGDVSIPMLVTGYVYGDAFQTSLNERGNRLIIKSMLDLSGAAAISWADQDGLVNVVGMEIRYYDYMGALHDTSVVALASGQKTLLPNFDVAKQYEYRTVYKPDSTSIDVFPMAYQTAPLLSEVNVLNNVTPATNVANDGSRWATLNNWITNDGAKSHNGYGGIDMRDNSIFFESGYGAPPVSNGKIYQVAMLPPGTYTFDGSVDWWNNNGYNYVYVAVAAGDTGLPDWNNIGAGIAYGQLTNGYDVQTQFTLAQATLVSFGVVLNMGRDSNDGESLRLKSLKLYINH